MFESFNGFGRGGGDTTSEEAEKDDASPSSVLDDPSHAPQETSSSLFDIDLYDSFPESSSCETNLES
jgi:hypothetical protein